MLTHYRMRNGSEYVTDVIICHHVLRARIIYHFTLRFWVVVTRLSEDVAWNRSSTENNSSSSSSSSSSLSYSYKSSLRYTLVRLNSVAFAL